jgi:hypothetical protein
MKKRRDLLGSSGRVLVLQEGRRESGVEGKKRERREKREKQNRKK